MGNCLITELKAEVNNENLPYLDSVVYTVVTNNIGLMILYPINAVESDKLTVHLLTDGYHFDAYPGSYTHRKIDDTTMETWGKTGYFGWYVKDSNNQAAVSTKIKIRVDNKYNLASLSNIADTNIEVFSYMPIESIISANGGCSGDVKALSHVDTIGTVNIYGATPNSITGDIESLVANHYSKFIVENSTLGLYGDIKNLPRITQGGSVSFGGYSGIHGSIESYVLRLRDNYPSNSGITVYATSGTGITFNGVVQTATNKILTWAPNASDNTKTDITFNDVTVTV